jgi:biopolymer transport protein ExbB/TolQ
VKRDYTLEFVYQIAALLVAIVLVHGFYVLVVRPNAAEILANQTAATEADPNYVQGRSAWVIVRDFEQEACFVLMLWALAIMAYKSYSTSRERKLLETELVPIREGTKILPEDTREYARGIEALPPIQQSALVPRALLSALHRFAATRTIQDVSDTAHGICEAESERLASELSMVRYIAWAIPSIGFIGTVRGIGAALGQAHKAVEGDISGVTLSLGVAFNSTFIALLISIVLMFLLHQLQLQQERLVLDTDSYLDRNLIAHLRLSADQGRG